jgi:uncharacterized protein (TIGR03083 family)
MSAAAAPVEVLDLFEPERRELFGVLDVLDPDAWAHPTICAGWSVKDITAHLLADDLGRLSRGRDGHRHADRAADEPLGTYIDRLNGQWVESARRLSPRVLLDLLAMTGEQTLAWFRTLDLTAIGGPVSWAGPDPAPVWLDIAREYTERWHHQQQIRDALGAPVLDDPQFLTPVLATFARALPVSLEGARAPVGTSVTLRITGDAGSDWSVVRDDERWRLVSGVAPAPDVVVTIDQDTAWRRFTRGIGSDVARARATISGDGALADRVLDAVAIIV